MINCSISDSQLNLCRANLSTIFQSRLLFIKGLIQVVSTTFLVGDGFRAQHQQLVFSAQRYNPLAEYGQFQIILKDEVHLPLQFYSCPMTNRVSLKYLKHFKKLKQIRKAKEVQILDVILTSKIKLSKNIIELQYVPNFSRNYIRSLITVSHHILKGILGNTLNC